mgnify:CR=1 FL=1
MILAINLQITGDKMSIKVDGNKFKKAHVTGPRHNFLSLSLTQDQLNFNFSLKDLNVDLKNINLSEEQIRWQILHGLDLINNKLGTNYRVTSAEFLSNDTNSDDIYAKLTFDIINEVHDRGLLNS